MKSLTTRTRHSLLLFAFSHHPEEFHDHEQISGVRTSSDEEDSRMVRTPAPVYKFVLDNHTQMATLPTDPETQYNTQTEAIGPQTVIYHDLVWVDENSTVTKT
jgi:hypothetical protein